MKWRDLGRSQWLLPFILLFVLLGMVILILFPVAGWADGPLYPCCKTSGTGLEVRAALPSSPAGNPATVIVAEVYATYDGETIGAFAFTICHSQGLVWDETVILAPELADTHRVLLWDAGRCWKSFRGFGPSGTPLGHDRMIMFTQFDVEEGGM
jgi:hypothetical protein